MSTDPITVVIDPGHGGRDPGAVGHGVSEKDVVLEVAIELGLLLEQVGLDVLLTRIDDVYLGLTDRTDIANLAGADLFLSIHANAATTPKAEGIETFHFPGSSQGDALASQVQGALIERFCPPNGQHKSRGVKAADFYVLRRTEMPAALVELEFVSHPEQAAFLADERSQRALAYAIARGVLRYLRMPYSGLPTQPGGQPGEQPGSCAPNTATP